MGRALLVVGWVATAGLVATGVLGYSVTREGGIGLHMLVGLVSALLILFSHCWIMFYLIGTGKAIKTAVADGGLESAVIERTKDFKNDSYPSLMLAMGLVMATFIIGGGVATEVIPPWIHHGLFYLTLLVQLRTLGIEYRVLRENETLMAQVSRRLADRSAG